MKLFLVALCLVQAANIAFANSVPVFVWGDTASQSAPAISNQATEKLEAVLSADATSKVIFVESQLNSDNFNHCSLEGKACFSFLAKQISKFYAPNVDSPVSYLRSRVWSGAVRSVNADSDFTVAAGETVFVHFRDGAVYPTQNERLAAHDAAIEDIVARLGTDKIVYVYTAIEDNDNLRRVARQATETEAVEWTSRGDQYVIRVLEITYTEGTDKKTLTIPATPTFTTAEGTAKLNLGTTPALVLDFVQGGGQWYVDALTFGDKNYTSGDRIGANDRFSYACTPTIVYKSNEGTTTLSITGLQLEIDLTRATEATKMAFSDAWNCVGFTSPGIWGGLFVTILLLAILTIGISWMLDINTMDRFDDSKGKTIIINATD